MDLHGTSRRYWVLAVAALCTTVASSLSDDVAFERFFGPTPPVLAVAAVAGVGVVALRLLAARGWPAVATRNEPRAVVDGLGWIAATAVLFAVVAIGFDNLIAFPDDMNTAWPQSILFYPSIAFVAEIVFHVVPLAVLTVGCRWQLDPRVDDRRVWMAIIAVACIETLFQTIDALTGADRRLAFFVAPQLFAFGTTQLIIFRRYSFLHMVAFRMVYYLIWHIAWGHLRLDLLF